MLPIARKRVLQIPHGLAACAAALCLVLAFSTDIHSRHDRISAENSPLTSADTHSGLDQRVSEAAVRADQRSEQRSREPVKRSAPTPLFPRFPGLDLNG